MATREELERALRGAHEAGDLAAARQLAAAIQGLPADGQQAAMEPGQARQEYEEMSVGQQIPQAAMDILRLASSGITFGGRDRLAQYLGGGSPEEEREATRQAMERAGTAVGHAVAWQGHGHRAV
jgi:hypothetical protein